MSKLLVVIGATGGQGGGVVERFLRDPEFKIRGITRNPNSAKAKALVAKGVEVVAANSDDPASLDRAFAGAYAIFAVTDFYDNFFQLGPEKSMEIEIQQGINLAKAATKVPTLQRYIWSTLVPSSDLSDGNVIVPHFESKSLVDKYIQTDPNLLAKTTFALFTIFATNLTAYDCFKPIYHVPSKKYIQFYPTSPDSPFRSLGDHRINTGIFVYAMIRNPPKGGSHVRCNIEDMTVSSFLALWGRASGKSPNPGSTMVIQMTTEQYVEMWGEMGVEQATQWKLFEYVAEHNRTYGSAFKDMIAAQDLMTEEEKASLVNTEESLKRMDWTGY